ncbi:2-oxo-4-hydroxy-4-carboxy-5-ureidoimidazoline decarboxylase [Vallicoccus soli]|uniref:2-oxo-4-hydroxy-4-carboxy-5-ureidoimidazoline decarboxylase n=1 Tax=Vallicoccus soli TaxID=2339232 RepID=A0A3A3Z739_9ACTN|nr:2-oxo-4-hydroxy-4-carboxy-5-ureidoimidazoline decarboxylase [Vallicoccus soli]
MPEPAVRALNAEDRARVVDLLLTCCAAPAWAAAVADRRPYASAEHLLSTARAELEALPEDEVDRALAAHPRLGEVPPGSAGALARAEQAGVAGSDPQARALLARAVERYEQRFGHRFLVHATGRGAAELVGVAKLRTTNAPAFERQVVRRELGEVTLQRLRGLLRVG